MKLFRNIPVLSLFFLATTILPASGQTVLKGKVINSRKEPVVASIRLKFSEIGTATDSSGIFSLSTDKKGNIVLLISAIGYTPAEVDVKPGDVPVFLTIEMKSEPGNLGEVIVIGAGSFEASDKAKGAALTPMDAMTVAGNGGDIANSLRALPGSQQIGEKEGLFVRGGTGEEAKQFVDGALLKNPNYTSVPGMMQPARLNPFLFKGILFSTGAYSALYGQAMSSALILETVDLPDESAASLHIFPMVAGAGFQNLAKDKRSSYGINAQWGNSQLYNRIINVKPDFFYGPEYISGDANFRTKTGKHGMLKFYTNYGYDRTGVRSPDLDSANLLSSYQSKGTNIYSNLSYRDQLNSNWKIDAVLAYNYAYTNMQNRLLDEGKNKIILPEFPYNQKNQDINTHSDFGQARVVFTRTFRRRQALRFGAEYFYDKEGNGINDTLNKLTDHLVAAFAEQDVYIAKNIAARIGLRAEYSSFSDRAMIAPRLGLAYRFKDGSQLNMAYGIFYQKPDVIYLLQNNNLDFSNAQHYILNYQKKAGNRLFRVEAYYKLYKKLVSTTGTTTNDGDGYARGFELFFRDKKTFKNFDYWISYTYLDTKRKFLDYPYALRPGFSTPHTASIAIKRFFQDINLNVNLSYTLATGRPYYLIQTGNTGESSIKDKGTTNSYSGLNMSFAYLFTMFKKWKNKDFSGIGLGMNNIFGRQQVFGYNYSYDGRNKAPITLPAARTFYFGLFMSFGTDKRDDFINNNL